MLTSVLRDSLGGNCKTVMVATVHPATAHTDESISTCKFAQRVAMVKNDVSVNEEVDAAALIQRLKEENRMLRESGGIADDDPSKQLTTLELSQLHAEVRSFVAAEDSTAVVQWGKGKKAAKVRHALWILKGLLLEGWRPHHAPNAEAWTVGLEDRAAKASAEAEAARGGQGEGGDGEGGNGCEGERGGLGGTKVYGWALPDVSDDNAPDPPPVQQQQQQRSREAAEAAEARQRRSEILRRAADAPASSPSQEAEELRHVESAFRLFYMAYEQGASLYGRQREAKAALRSSVERAQAVGHSLRTARDDVAAAKAAVEARRVSLAVASVLPAESGYEWHVDDLLQQAAAGTLSPETAIAAGASAAAGGREGGGSPVGGAPAADREEVRLCEELVNAKTRYHSLAEELKRLKQQCTALQARSEGLHAACEAAFQNWWPIACEEHGLAAPGTNAATGGACGAADGGAAEAATSVSQGASQSSRGREAWGEGGGASAGGGADGGGGGADGGGGGADGGGGGAGDSTEMDAAAWLGVLQEPEAALAAFRQSHWDSRKAAARDDLKRRLNEAYSGAKEAGELVGRKRASVQQLKAAVVQADAAGGEAGGEVEGGGENGAEAVERLRCQLSLDTTLYKGAVQTLRELKAEIEGLQEELRRSQAGLTKDFQRWHEPAVAEAKARLAAASGGHQGEGAAGRRDPMKVAFVSRAPRAIPIRDATNVMDL